MTIYEDASLCEECGGKCCKRLPGCYFPDDFNNDINKIQEALSNSAIAIDWWEGDTEPDDTLDRVYFLRPRTKNGGKVDPSWGGVCIHLKDNGCELEFKDRPKGCRLLEPRTDKCKDHSGNIYQAAVEWRKYRDVINEFVASYREGEEATP